MGLVRIIQIVPVCSEMGCSARGDFVAPNRIILLVPAVASFALWHDDAAAQTAAANQIPEEVTITANLLSITNLQTMSTAGSRLDLTPLETPASVTVLPGDVVRNLDIQSVVSAETLAPGVSSVPINGSGGNLLSARGFYGSNAIAQLYDGMMLFNAGNVVVFPFDPWNVQRIDVLTGPASVLYGTGAVGGAFNVVPKQPNPVEELNIGQASWGSFNTYHAAFDSTGPVTDDLAYRAMISGNKSTGWMQRGNWTSFAPSLAFQYQAAPDLILTLSDDYGDIHPSTYEGTPVVNNQVVTKLIGQNYNIGDAAVDFKENILRLKEDWNAAGDLSFTNDSYAISHYRLYHETYNYVYSPTTNLVTRNNFRDINANQIEYGDHGFATWKNNPFGLTNETLAGFDVNNSVYLREDNTGATGSYPGKDVVPAIGFAPGAFPAGTSLAYPQYHLTLTQAGVFAEDRLTLADNLFFSAGARFDNYNLSRITFFPASSVGTLRSSHDAPGGNAGLLWQPIVDLSLYAQYSYATNPVTSLASDSVADIGFGFSPAQQEEVGAKQSLFGGQVQWTLALYHIVENNLLTPSVANPNVSELVGQQSSRGIEASVAYTPLPGVTLSANGTLLHSQFDDYVATVSGKAVSLAGDVPQFVPEQTANIIASWNFLPDWQVRGLYQYVGRRFSDNPNQDKMPAYYVFNLGLRYNITPRVNLDFAANNVANKVFAAAAGAGIGNQWLLGEPRNFTFTMNFAL